MLCTLCRFRSLLWRSDVKQVMGSIDRHPVDSDQQVQTGSSSWTFPGGEPRNNHRYAVVVQNLPTQWSQSCPCETKTSQPGAEEETKSHSHWQFLGIRQILWRSFSESLYVNTDQKPMGPAREQCAESRKRHLQCCCSPVWTNGGRNLWNVTFLSAKHSRCLVWLEDTIWRRYGMSFKGPVIPFVEYHPVTTSRRKNVAIGVAYVWWNKVKV